MRKGPFGLWSLETNQSVSPTSGLRMREPSHSLFKGAGLDRPVLTGLTQTTTRERRNNNEQLVSMGHTNISPLVIRRLWYCVLGQAIQYLRYISQPSHIDEIQTKLNSSLQKAFKYYGQPTTLQAELGIPPLIYYRHKELIRLHFRFTTAQPNSLAASLYQHRHKTTSITQQHPTPIIEQQILQSILQIFPTWTPLQPLPQPHYLITVHPKNLEKKFANTLKPIISNLWRSTLLQHQKYPVANSRLAAYITIAGGDLHRPDLFTPTPYLQTFSKINTSALLRVRTQHEHAIPAHQHLQLTLTRSQHLKKRYIDYTQRDCHLCNPPPHNNSVIVASEEHYIFLCPHTTNSLLEPLQKALNRHLRFLRMPPITSLLPHKQLSLTLGGPPPLRWATKKINRETWISMTTPHCALLAINLSHTLQKSPPPPPTPVYPPSNTSPPSSSASSPSTSDTDSP